MREIVKDILWYDGDDNENFSLIDPELNYPGLDTQKDIDDLFNDPMRSGHINSGQHKVRIRCQTMESFYEVISYFISQGWYRKLFISYPKSRHWAEDTEIKKVKYTISEIENQIKDNNPDNYSSWDVMASYAEFDVLIDRDSYYDLYEVLSHIPGYKVIWRKLYINRWEFRKNCGAPRYIIE